MNRALTRVKWTAVYLLSFNFGNRVEFTARDVSRQFVSQQKVAPTPKQQNTQTTINSESAKYEENIELPVFFFYTSKLSKSFLLRCLSWDWSLIREINEETSLSLMFNVGFTAQSRQLEQGIGSGWCSFPGFLFGSNSWYSFRIVTLHETHKSIHPSIAAFWHRVLHRPPLSAIQLEIILKVFFRHKLQNRATEYMIWWNVFGWLIYYSFK